MISIGLFFVFSTLGLSLLYLSQVYLKTTGYRKNSLVLDYSSENGIKRGFEYLLGLIGRAPSPLFITEEKTEALRSDARGGGMLVAEETLGARFPILVEETFGGQAWKSETRAGIQRLDEKADSFAVTYRLDIGSEGTLSHFSPKRLSTLETDATFLVGHAPLAPIPLLIDKVLSAEERESFLSTNQIILQPSGFSPLTPRETFSDDRLIPSEAGALLSEALKIEIFRPQDMSAPRLRAVLGLEASSDPVPEGVYLIRDALGLGGVYVHGDLDEMVLAIDGDFQVISFRKADKFWRLEFSPSKGQTHFLTPDGETVYDLLPRSIVVVRGKVASLGGGEVDSGGNVSLVRDRELPSILSGTDLTIVSSDEIAISSHLILQGAKWERGLPYVKGSKSQLVIYSTGQDFWDGTARQGGIRVDSLAPSNIKIQAALTAGGAGFTIGGEGKGVEVLGSIQAKDYTSNGNTLLLRFDERIASPSPHLQNSPRAAVPIVVLSSLRVLGWREY